MSRASPLGTRVLGATASGPRPARARRVSADVQLAPARTPAENLGFSTKAAEFARETDCLLEGTGFELSVPREIGVPSVAHALIAYIHESGSTWPATWSGAMKQIASLTVTLARCSTLRSWPGISQKRAPHGSGSGTGLGLRAWRAFRFRRTAASRISRAPRWRPHD